MTAPLERCPSPHNGYTVNVTIPGNCPIDEMQAFRRSEDRQDTELKITKGEDHFSFCLSVTYIKTHQAKPIWELSVENIRINTLRKALFGAKELYVIAQTEQLFDVIIVSPKGPQQHKIFTPIEKLIDAAFNGRRKPWAICYSNYEVITIYGEKEIIVANTANTAWQKLTVTGRSSNDLDPSLQTFHLQLPGKKDVVDLNFSLEGDKQRNFPTNVYYNGAPFKVV